MKPRNVVTGSRDRAVARCDEITNDSHQPALSRENTGVPTITSSAPLIRARKAWKAARSTTNIV